MFRKATAAVVHIQGDRIVIERSREDIRVPIPIHIRCKHRTGTICVGGDDLFRKATAAVVHIQGDRIVKDGVLVGCATGFFRQGEGQGFVAFYYRVVFRDDGQGDTGCPIGNNDAAGGAI